MNIAVVDEGGNLVSHARMDGAWIGSIDISINKAFTSREIRHRCSFYDPGSSVDSVAEPLVPRLRKYNRRLGPDAASRSANWRSHHVGTSRHRISGGSVVAVFAVAR